MMIDRKLAAFMVLAILVAVIGIGAALMSKTANDSMTTVSVESESLPGFIRVSDYSEVGTLAPCGDVEEEPDVEFSGETLDAGELEDKFELDEKTAAEIASLNNADEQGKAVAKALEGNPAFEVVQRDGKTIVNRPFMLKRIAVTADAGLKGKGSATGAVYDDISKLYLLSYDTMTEAAQDYERIENEISPDGGIIVDLPVSMMGASSDYDGWGVKRMNMTLLEDALDECEYTHPVKVAVLDGGVRSTHVAFADVTFDPDSGSFINSTSTEKTSDDFSDTDGHGSHVTGIITSATPDAVSILELRVFAPGKIKGSLTDVYYGIQYAQQHGARVVNMSLGSELCSDGSGTLTRAMQKTMASLDKVMKAARDSGMFLVAATGNDQRDFGKYYVYPAISPYVVSVGAIDGFYECAGYSNYGDTIDFCAPGTAVKTVDKKNDTSTCTMSGTSMASPHIAAVAADLLAIYPDLMPDELYEKIKSICMDLGDEGHDPLFGYGMPVFEDLSIVEDAGKTQSPNGNGNTADDPAGNNQNENASANENANSNEPGNGNDNYDTGNNGNSGDGNANAPENGNNDNGNANDNANGNTDNGIGGGNDGNAGDNANTPGDDNANAPDNANGNENAGEPGNGDDANSNQPGDDGNENSGDQPGNTPGNEPADNPGDNPDDSSGNTPDENPGNGGNEEPGNIPSNGNLGDDPADNGQNQNGGNSNPGNSNQGQNGNQNQDSNVNSGTDTGSGTSNQNQNQNVNQNPNTNQGPGTNQNANQNANQNMNQNPNQNQNTGQNQNSSGNNNSGSNSGTSNQNQEANQNQNQGAGQNQNTNQNQNANQNQNNEIGTTTPPDDGKTNILNGNFYVSGFQGSYDFTGAALTPQIRIYEKTDSAERFLTQGTDYNVSYLNNRKAGIAYARIDGMGGYKGTAYLQFKIKNVRYFTNWWK